MKAGKLRFGTAYYEEYMPCERLEQDVAMMQKAGINTVRIAESTWSTCEPQPGVFDFSHVVRVMDAMEAAGIDVIIGTPTYAVPSWMVRMHPEVMAVSKAGREHYGRRQIMDITNPTYMFYAERVIRELMKVTAHRACVVGFQLDNETKYYDTSGRNVQQMFVTYLREKFQDDLDAMNAAFGLDYWSNRVDAWEDFADVRFTINGSLGAEFAKFQRTLVDRFLQWQADIVKEYCREDQFLTHNFDYEWRGYSFGIQPQVNHFHVTVAGVDIYHKTQDELTGKEISFGGAVSRSLKGGENYLVLETEAQGQVGWLPYPGQLRLQAYSHLAAGANSVCYWHWHSIHNSLETYWRGILSHDFEENETYREVCRIGAEFAAIGDHLVNVKKKNEVALLVSNEALTALDWFPPEDVFAENGIRYNDIVRWMFDALFDLNVECDILWPESGNFSDYRVIVVPALYAAPDELLLRLKKYALKGGHLVVSFKSAFADENVKVSHERAPRILREVLGVSYQQYTIPGRNVGLVGRAEYGDVFSNNLLEAAAGSPASAAGTDRVPPEPAAVHGANGPGGAKSVPGFVFPVGEHRAEAFMELLIPEGAAVLAAYDHPAWGRYAALTYNRCGEGSAAYMGTMTDAAVLKAVLRLVLGEAGVDLSRADAGVTVREGINEYGRRVLYYLNYSPEKKSVRCEYTAQDLLGREIVPENEERNLEPWGLMILEELQ